SRIRRKRLGATARYRRRRGCARRRRRSACSKTALCPRSSKTKARSWASTTTDAEAHPVRAHEQRHRESNERTPAHRKDHGAGHEQTEAADVDHCVSSTRIEVDGGAVARERGGHPRRLGDEHHYGEGGNILDSIYVRPVRAFDPVR